MKIFFDTEFTGLHQSTTLISIGCISEQGHTFYGEFIDYDKSQVDDWIQGNVIAGLKFGDTGQGSKQFKTFPNVPIIIAYNLEVRGNKEKIRIELERWFLSILLPDQDDCIYMWSDCLAYDWVLFCQLWGGALKVPAFIYYIPFDICTLFQTKGINPDVNREKFARMTAGIKDKHNALWDAIVIRACYEKLVEKLNEQSNSRQMKGEPDVNV